MNNSKIWLVVNPTVGVPLFLGAVAVGSFSVHVAVLTNTGWVSDFLNGQPLGTAQAAIEAPVQPASYQADAQMIAQVADHVAAEGERRAVVTLPDGRTAYVVIKDPDKLAALSPGAEPITPD